MEKFTIHKIHKLEDYLEQIATDWMTNAVTDHFEVEIEELSQEQILEVQEFCDEADDGGYGYGLVATGLRSVINQWEEEVGWKNED